MAQLKTYWPELDGLRTCAVVAVILVHSDPGGVFRGGYAGVDIFFVLSGFLITSLLASEVRATGTIRLKSFYWHRFLRLMPALLFMLAGYALAAPFLWPGYEHWKDVLVSALYLSDYSKAFWNLPNYLGHTWSLSVEEHFYLLWPLLLIPLVKARCPVRFLLCAFAVGTLWRLAFVWDWQLFFYRFDTRATGLILGACLFFALPALKPNQGWAWAGAAVLLTVCLLAPKEGAVWAITMAELASAGLVAALISGNSGPVGSLLRHPAMVWGGKLSYAMYLWHYPFARFIRDEFDFLTTAILTVGFSVCMAAISYHTVESWGRKIRRLQRSAVNIPSCIPK